jgi:RNA polymerase sigma factor (sigma-70 family)
MSDEDLAIVAAYDDEAWSALYVRTLAYARRVASRVGTQILGAAWTAEDSSDHAQEAMVRAWQHRAKYRPVSAFRTWLAAIVANHVRKGTRRMKTELQTLGSVHAGIDADGTSTYVGDAPPSPLEHTIHVDDAARVAEVLERLAEGDRRFLLLWADGRAHEYAEVGGDASATAQALRSRAFNAKKRFRKAYASAA